MAPLIAFIHWEIQKPDSLRFVEHVIVDEAQDVTPLEWLLLDEINEADAWTILGDLNQRRSDHTLATWAEVLEVIAIERETPIRKMQRGYRSTRPILEYANQLLPRDQRPVFAFQESGPLPTIRKVRERDLGDRALDELERLLDAYPSGTVAAICQTPSVVTNSLRIVGWVNDGRNRSIWTKGDRAVNILVPDAARGLEFDAVVVVEPAAFPTRYGRLGTLYTALTRANRELAVVHATPLPKSLKAL
ncbi:MAG: ATP-binding domain-containing protein [Actinomycetota bacterium]